QLRADRLDGRSAHEPGLGPQPAREPRSRDPRPHRGPSDASPRGDRRTRAVATVEARRPGLSAVRGIPGEDHPADPGVPRRAETLRRAASTPSSLTSCLNAPPGSMPNPFEAHGTRRPTPTPTVRRQDATTTDMTSSARRTWRCAERFAG